MDTVSIALFAGIVLVFVAIILLKMHKKSAEYYLLLLSGLMWFALGIVLDIPAFFVLGVIFVILEFMYKPKNRS